MEKLKEVTGTAVLKILIVGNNPIELSRLLENLKNIKDKTVITEIAFDTVSITQRLSKFLPDYILIDDNVGREELKSTVAFLQKDRRSKNIPITVLKNSNYREAISTGVLDFLLKENLTGDAIYRALNNSLKIRQTQLYLYQSYKKRKGQLARLFVRSQPSFQI